MKTSSFHLSVWIGLLALGTLLSVWFLTWDSTPASSEVETTISIGSRQPGVEHEAGEGGASREVMGGGRDLITQLWGFLSSRSGDENLAHRLAEFRARLLALPSEEACKVIEGFLVTGRDAGTHLEFEIGKGGTLTSAPTLRVLLLDLLEEIDPDRATALAYDILDEHGSADEWAISMRTLARRSKSTEEHDYLRGKMRDLIHHEPWIENPSVGFYEAFDIAVLLGGRKLCHDLTSLVCDSDRKDLAHAAGLAVDRLMIHRSGETLGILVAEPSLLAEQTSLRAALVARADVSDSKQVSLLEEYLLSDGLMKAELAAFADVFPNPNYRISNNLVTVTPVYSGRILARRDRVALGLVEEWVGDKRFERLRPELERIRLRLTHFVGQALD